MPTFNGTSAPETISGTNEIDTFFGRGGDDNLFGLGDTDTFTWFWGDGTDTINGGPAFGFDLAILFLTTNGGHPNQTFMLTADPAQGRNVASYGDGSAGNPVTPANYLIDTESFRLHIEATAGFATIQVLLTTAPGSESAGASEIFNYSDAAVIVDASTVANPVRFSSGAAADRFYGGLGDDAVQSRGGNDILDAGGGRNVLLGGPGDDIYIARRDDILFEQPGEGTDAVVSRDTFFRLPLHFESLSTDRSSTASFTGIGNDQANLIEGWLGGDTLIGFEGDDVLIGGAGAANTLQGGTGNDVYYVDAVGDSIIDNDGEGLDQVRTSLSFFTATTSIEQILFVGTGDFVGVGNDGVNLIVGGAGNDILDGGNGANELFGHAGDDILIGGTEGVNTLIGGPGRDIYFTHLRADSAVEEAGQGNDQIRTSLASHTLRANFEELVFIGTGNFIGIGNSLDNYIAGGNGGDNLNGGVGNDTLAGGAGAANEMLGGVGNDTFIVSAAGDTIVEKSGEGVDTVLLDLGTFTIPAEVENLIVRTSSDTRVTGNVSANAMVGGAGRDNLSGGAGADALSGGEGNDFLSGGSGDDVLTGGVGGDELAGGLGADRYVFQTSASGKDLLHDFSRAEGDKIDVRELLTSIGFIGNPFETGHLATGPIAAFGPGGPPATRVLFDPDGARGPQAAIELLVVLGSTNAVESQDFIFS